MSNFQIVGISVLSVALLALPNFSYASHQQDVLGDSTAAQIDFPAITDGPGFILPDSPLYIIDKAFQKFKLATSLSPEQKVKTRMLLIGERMAELRAMIVRENKAGTQRALDELALESDNLSFDIRDAAGQGKKVGDLAKDINDRLQLHRDILSKVSGQSDDVSALKIEAVRQSLLTAKVSAEDYLPEAFLVQAITDDLEDGLETDVLGVETSAVKFERKLEKLQKHASRSAEREERKKTNQYFKEKKKEIKAEFNAQKKALKEQRKKLMEERKAKLETLREERKVKLEEAREAVKKAREAAKRLREIREEEKKNTEEGVKNDEDEIEDSTPTK